MTLEKPYIDYLSCTFYISVCLCLLVYLWRSFTDPLSKIPGPKGWPLIGHILHLKTPLFKQFTSWSRTHGPIYKVSYPGNGFLVVSGEKELYEMLQVKCKHFEAQHHSLIINAFQEKGITNVFFSYNSEKRTNLKNLTMKSIQTSLNDESYQTFMHSTMDRMCETIRKCQQTQTDPWMFVTKTINDLTFYMLYGRMPSDLERNDAHQGGEEMHEILTFHFSYTISNHSLFRWMPNKMHKLKNNLMWLVTSFYQNKVVQCIGSDNHCILSSMWQKRTSEPNKKLHMNVGDLGSTACTVMDGAQLALASDVYNCIAILSQNTQMQEKLQEEIYCGVGNRCPSALDRQHLPYIASFLMETLRYTAPTPVLGARRTLHDTNIGGYDIPEGTVLAANIWGVLHDPDVWDDPWTIRPDRFLDAQGNLLPPSHPLRKSWMVFGAGDRSCMGQRLAQDTLFIIIVKILQNFTIYPGTHSNTASDPNNYIDMGIHRAKPYKVIFEPRVTT